jgi:hypothetical protein
MKSAGPFPSVTAPSNGRRRTVKIAVITFSLLAAIFAARAAEPVPVWVPPDYRIEVLDKSKPKPDGEAALVKRKNTPEVVARLDSIASFKQFVSTMKKGERVDFSIGCVCHQFVERDDKGAARKSGDGREIYFLPLGREKITIAEATAFCAAQGVKFRFDVGGP